MMVLYIWVGTHDFDIYENAQKPPLNAHADISRASRCLNFGLNLLLLSYFCIQAAKALASLRIFSDALELYCSLIG